MMLRAAQFWTSWDFWDLLARPKRGELQQSIWEVTRLWKYSRNVEGEGWVEMVIIVQMVMRYVDPLVLFMK